MRDTAAPSPAPAGTARVAASRTKWWSSRGCCATRKTADTAIQAPEREQLEPPQEHDCAHETDGHEHSGRRSPVERMEKHALEVVRQRRAEAAGVAMVGDDRLPELAERARVGDEQHRPDGKRSRSRRAGGAPRAAGDEQHGQRRDNWQGEQLDGDRGASQHACRRPPPRAAAGVERDRDRAEREGHRRCVCLHARRLHGPRRGDGEQRRGAEASPDARQLPADCVGGDQPDERDEHERQTNPFDAVARRGGTVPAGARRSPAAARRRRPSQAPVRDAERRATRDTRPRRSSRLRRGRGRRRAPRSRATRRARARPSGSRNADGDGVREQEDVAELGVVDPVRRRADPVRPVARSRDGRPRSSSAACRAARSRACSGRRPSRP